MAYVTLLAHTPEPEKLVAAAGKLCYSQSNVTNLMDQLTEEKTHAFLDRLSEYGHESPVEHVSFTFGIEGVSRAFLAQITRHRIASYSVQSQRYVNKENFDYIVPPEIAAIPEGKEAFAQAMESAAAHYGKLVEVLTEAHTQTMIDEGMEPGAARRAASKKANEDARFVLPNACDTKMVVTMNARSLYNFFRHRCCNRAQWEIRDVAEQMLRLVYGVAPALFAKAGPPCVKGPCPEGKMSCGKMAGMREKYDVLKREVSCSCTKLPE